MKKIFFILIIFYCAFVNILAQEQSYCELLDTALVHYCRELDPNNKCVLVKSSFYYKENPYTIEQNHKVINTYSGINVGDEVFEAPSIYYQSDTLTVFCAACRCNKIKRTCFGLRKNYSFFYGSSVFSTFIYSPEDNKWHYSKSKTSELEFRLSDVYDELCNKCAKSVVDTLSKESENQIIHLKWIFDYFPRLGHVQLDSIPSNATFKCSKRICDYAIGYPTVKFFGKQVEFSLKVIKRKDYKPNCFPKEGRTFSITVNIEDIESLKIRGLE